MPAALHHETQRCKNVPMVKVSNADRFVFPDVARTKGDVVAYYEQIAPRALPHLTQRPLSIRRYPKGLAAPGFFQKNVPAHYPESIARFGIPRSRAATKKHRDAEQDVTLYPLITSAEHLAYLANQGAIELHVPAGRVPDLHLPDRLVIDLDPPEHAFASVRRAARMTRDALAELGLASVPIATGSKGYHVVVALSPTVEAWTLALATQKFAALLVAKHPDQLSVAYRIALRGERVFIDWLRNNPSATVVAPYALRAKPRASVAAPLTWDELDHTDPDAFSIDDVQRLLDRPDSLAELSASPSDPAPFVAAVDAAFERSALVLEVFDRFRP
jgi:bifunctional non-homologous end joining protein LigD